MINFRNELLTVVKEITMGNIGTNLYARMIGSFLQGNNAIREIVTHYAKITRMGRKDADFYDLITPLQVTNAISTITKRIPAEIKVLDHMLLATKTVTNESHINTHGYFPIISTAKFTLFKFTATPIEITNNSYTVLDMPEDIVGVNYGEQQLVELTTNQLGQCLQIGAAEYACSTPVRRRLGTTENCVIEAMYGNKQTCQQKTKTFQINHVIWKQLLMPGTWLYITPYSTSIAVQCNTER